jgi:hypothetical protein
VGHRWTGRLYEQAKHPKIAGRTIATAKIDFTDFSSTRCRREFDLSETGLDKGSPE